MGDKVLLPPYGGVVVDIGESDEREFALFKEVILLSSQSMWFTCTGSDCNVPIFRTKSLAGLSKI